MPGRASRVRVGVASAAAGLALASLLAVGSAAGAATTNLYVDQTNPACSDSGAGTSTQPFCTILRGAKVATAGQTVTVATGTYAGGASVANSGTATAPITFAAAPGATVVVQGGTDGFKVSAKSWIVISGFTVTGSSGAGIYLSSASNVTVADNHVTYSGQPVSGLTARGIRLANTSSSTITRNTTDHNSDAGVGITGTSSNGNVVSGNVSFANARGYVRAAAGFDVRDGTGNIVTGNVSHDNEDSGFNLWTSIGSVATDNVGYHNGDHGIDVHNATNTTVVANTVHGNVDSGIEMTTSTGTYLADNISADNGINSPRTSGQIRADAASVGTARVDDDVVSMSVPGVMVDWAGVRYSSLAAFQAATGREPNGRQGDPRFVAPATGDFHIGAGSAAIDDANSGASAYPTKDFDGRVRVDDPNTADTGTGPIGYGDRGAFEYQPA